MTLSFTEHAHALKQRYAALDPKIAQLRARDLAVHLNVSEAALVAAECGLVSRPLQNHAFPTLFRQLGSLGEVMALTRNPWCVHEQHGRYENITFHGPIGMTQKSLELRVYIKMWKTAFVVQSNTKKGPMRSLQFFDETGTAIHKIYQTERTHASAFDALVSEWEAKEKTWPVGPPQATTEKKPVAVDREALRQRWLALKDVHDFLPMVRTLGISRFDAVSHAGSDLAQRVKNDTVEQLLQAMAECQQPLMCFVRNIGIAQIYIGTVSTLSRTGPWYNVQDPTFNLHLNTEGIDSTWVVCQPSRDGWIVSLDVYSDDGSMIVQFFAYHKEGQGPDAMAAWNTRLCRFCSTPLAAQVK